MTAPDLATRLREWLEAAKAPASLGWQNLPAVPIQLVEEAVDLLTRHQAERETLRAQIEALPRYGIVLSRRSASTELEPDGKYVYIADVLALLAKGETP